MRTAPSDGRTLDGLPVSTSMIAAGETARRYELRGRIGVGAHGVVFRARDHQLGRDVAIKRFSHAVADDPEAMRRITREVRALAQVTHPNVVTVHDLVTLPDGDGEPTPHLVMELVEGRSLKELLAEQGPNVRHAEVVRGVLAGLAACHAAGVLHLDVKPANVLVLPAGGVKLVDFGIARAASDSTATIAGTPPYMAPEQAEGRAGEASDLYAVGCLLFECLTGRPPFEGTVAQQLMAHRHAPRPDATRYDPRIPVAVARFAQQAMAIEPAERFGSAHAMLQALDRAVQDRSMVAPPTQTIPVVAPAAARPAAPVDPTAITAPVQPVTHAVPDYGRPVRRRDRWATTLIALPLAALITALIPAVFWALSSLDPASRYRSFLFDETDGILLWLLALLIAGGWIVWRRREFFSLVAGPQYGSYEPSGWQSAPARQSRRIAVGAGFVGSIPMILPWYVAIVVGLSDVLTGVTVGRPEDDPWAYAWVMMPAAAVFLFYAAVRRIRLRLGSLLLSMFYFTASAAAAFLFLAYPHA